jgi:hypothetical protein
MNGECQPYRERAWVTLARTGGIAGVVGLVLAWLSRGGVWGWVLGTLIALWPALGGHFVELVFLNWVRRRVSGGWGGWCCAGGVGRGGICGGWGAWVLWGLSWWCTR